MPLVQSSTAKAKRAIDGNDMSIPTSMNIGG